jgi:hypothetical protein
VAGMLNFEFNSFNAPLRTELGKEIYAIRQYNLTTTLFSTAESNYTYGALFSRNFINLKPETYSGDEAFEYFKNKGYTSSVFFLKNTLERPFYPRYGSKTNLFFTYSLGFEGDFRANIDSTIVAGETKIDNVLRSEIDYLKITRISKSLSVISDSRLSFSSIGEDDLINVINFTYAGGFHPRVSNSVPFYGAINYDYSLASYFMTKLEFQYEPLDNFLLTAGLNFVSIAYPMKWLGMDFEGISDLAGETNYRVGLGGSVGYLSVIGPITISLGWDTQRKDLAGNLNIGFYF